MLNCKTFSKKRTSKRSAFTLIELSIVLIIIGLLVAGVTGGASLIRSAQLRSVMSEARGFNVAVNAFVVQYDALPGDYATAIGASDFGNGNGQINYVDFRGAGPGGTPVAASTTEGLIAWYHLINSNTIDESLTVIDVNHTVNGDDAIALTTGTNIPKSKLDGVGWVFDYSTDRNVVIATGTVALVDVASVLDTAYHIVALGAITPSDSLSIDTKLDDGVANAGRVQASELLGDTATTQTDCFTTTTYNTAQAGEHCALEFTVDIS